MAQHRVRLEVNGEQHELEVEPRLLLVHLLRDRLGLTGTHVGCDTSNCGACTVHVDGESVKSCTVLAVQADGAEVTTIEGMADGDVLHPLQEAFWQEHGLQCGFCTPGMIMAAADLLQHNPDPSEDEIRAGLEGNLCRCTGYHNIVRAVRAAADRAFVMQSAMIPSTVADAGVGGIPTAWVIPGQHPSNHKPLAVDRARYVGEPVAVLVATSAFAARDAAELIDVEYEPLPAAVDAMLAREAGAPLVRDD